MRKFIESIIVFIILVNTCCTVEHVNTQQESIDLEKMCEALEDLKLRDTYISSASIVPTDGDLPEQCRVIPSLPTDLFKQAQRHRILNFKVHHNIIYHLSVGQQT